MNHNVGNSFDGIPAIANAIQLYQASSAPFVNQQRITGGIGRQDLLLPGLDVDLFGVRTSPQATTSGSSIRLRWRCTTLCGPDLAL